jgi:biopolymer transport protein ExbD
MKKKAEHKTEVPMAAMIDVVFLLLIYFVVTSTAIVDEANVAVNLPGSTKLPPEEMDLTLDVKVLEGSYEISGSKYNLKEAENYFMRIANVSPDATVNVKVAKKASHQQLVLVLDRLNKAKLNKFSLHTLK